MKTSVLLLGLVAFGWAGLAQTNAAQDAASPAADTPLGWENQEVVPLIVIDEVPLTDAIRNLARQSGLNFQFDPRITSGVKADGTPQVVPNISLRFENVTPAEALLAVLENHNLKLIKEPRSKIARITVRDPLAEEPLIARVVQLHYAPPADIAPKVKMTLSPHSQVVADVRTSQLIVSTTEKELDGMLELVAKLDAPTKQVLIESKIIETSTNPSSVKGIDWTGTLAAQNVSIGNNGEPGGVLSAPSILARFNNGSFFTPATAFLNADGVNATISFLNTQSDTELVATPRAVTMNNEMAQLSVTKAFPIFKITPGSANSPAGAEITYTNLGTILMVTPRIAANSNISLRVVPEVSNIDSIDVQTLNGTRNTANIYSIRKIETQVMIPSGHTLVMGGMLNDSHTKGYTKVPILGDAPLIGMLFRSSRKVRTKVNLLIFITPTIIEDGDYQVATTDFLKTKATEPPEVADVPFNSAKPVIWTKPGPPPAWKSN